MWLIEELKKLDPDRTELRKFSLILGGAFLALGAFAWYRGSAAAPYLLVPGALIALVGVALPAAVRWLFFVWMALGLVLGTIVTSLILTLVFVLAVTPIGLMLRAVGRDPMNRKLDPDAPTYWIPKERLSTDRSRLEKYF
jgi:hypothetical protein